MSAILTYCPLCEASGKHPLTPFKEEFLLADHLMEQHLHRTQGFTDHVWQMRCFCGLHMSRNICILLAHLRDKGGAEVHYRAHLLGID